MDTAILPLPVEVTQNRLFGEPDTSLIDANGMQESFANHFL
jgi:hypothetical protein